MAADTMLVLAPHNGGTCDSNLWIALSVAVLLHLFLLYMYVLVPRRQGARQQKERPQTRVPRSTMRSAHSENAATVFLAAPRLATWNLSMPDLRPRASLRKNSEADPSIREQRRASLPASMAKPTARSSDPCRGSEPTRASLRKNSEADPSIRDQRRASLPASMAKPTARSSDPWRGSEPSVPTSSEMCALEALCREDRRRRGLFKADIDPYTPLGARQVLSQGPSSSSIITPLVPTLSQCLQQPRVSTQSVSSQRLQPPRVSTAAPIQDQRPVSLPTVMAKPTLRSSDPQRSSDPKVPTFREVRDLKAHRREDRQSRADVVPFTPLSVRQALSLGASSSSIGTPLVPASSQRLPPPRVNTQAVSSQHLPPPRVNTAAPIQDQRPVSSSTSIAIPTPHSSDLQRNSKPRELTFREVTVRSFEAQWTRREDARSQDPSSTDITPYTPLGAR